MSEKLIKRKMISWNKQKNPPVTKECWVMSSLQGIYSLLVIFGELLHFAKGSDRTRSVDTFKIVVEDGRPTNRYYPFQLSWRRYVEALYRKEKNIAILESKKLKNFCTTLKG